MVYLEFVVVSYNGQEVNKIVALLQKCGFHVREWNILFQSNTQPKTTVPNFREGCLKVHFQAQGTRHNHLTVQEAYGYLARDWIKVTANLDPARARPSLIFQNRLAFPRVWDATQMNIKLDELSFGTLSYPSHFVVHFRWPGSSVDGAEYPSNVVVADFYHDIMTAEFSFEDLCKLKFTYAAIRGIVVKYDGTITDVLLNLVHPVMVYEMETVEHSGKKRTFLTRVETIPFCKKAVTPTVLGKSTTMRLRIGDPFTAQKLISRLHFRCGGVPVSYVAVSNEYLVNPDTLDDDTKLPDFDCGFLLSALVHRNFVLQLQYLGRWDLLLDSFTKWAVEDPVNLKRALADLVRLLDDGVIVDYMQAAKLLMDYHRMKGLKEPVLPRGSCMVPQVTITPTRFILWPPELMNDNRILRNFDAKYGLRITFREDNLSKLNLRASTCSSEIMDRVIRLPMLRGLDIAGRHYVFLAWSNSQLRDHGVWMYAPDPRGTNAAIIREWMGDFSHISNVSKFMARMGQCFSQTEDTLAVPQDELHVVTVPDIVGGVHPESRKPYCFSDGVGQISKPLVEKVCEKLELPGIRSAFQMRYAGYKGMLVLNPTLKDVDIVFRESMYKFPCKGAARLEIVKPSEPVAVFLNRQLITILDHMKVPSSVFLKLQESTLMSLTDMFVDEEKAAFQLRSTCPLQLDFTELVRCGISLTTEPFFRAMLLALHRANVDWVKTKARIAIDPSLGRYMFGVLDETGKLEYGQVFVQYTTDVLDKEGKSFTVLQERVLVTKNPCLQPGDVRIFEAVDVPELHHIVDCIVFPRKGPRPHPDEMAGSDLDGDEYTVIWNKELFFRGDNAPPEVYPCPVEQRSNKPVQVEDMIDCLCNYICNDNLGVLGNAHLALSDNNRYGLNSGVCKSLARKFSLAVDSAKTGQQLQLEQHERVMCYPDFMEKGGRATSYRSQRALGKLYRVCRDFEELNRSSIVYSNPVPVDMDLVYYPGWLRYHDSAIKARDKYARHLQSILSTFGVTHEAEATAKAFTKLHSHLQERRDKSDIEDLIAKAIQNLWTNTKLEFWKEFEDTTVDQHYPTDMSVLSKASAWYVVAYVDENNNGRKFLSFPWVVARELGVIKTERMSGKQIATQVATRQPFVANLDRILMGSVKKFVKLSPACSSLLNGCCLDVESSTLELATRLLLQWAKHCKLIGSSLEKSQYEEKQSISEVTLVRLFLHIMEELCNEQNEDGKQVATCLLLPVGLFLEFLRFCVSLRFMDEYEADEALPIPVRNSKYLGKMAMQTYHCIATEGHLASAGIAENLEAIHEAYEMEPMRIPMVIGNGRVRDEDIELLKKLLKDWAGVSVVHVRREKGSLMISAAGTLQSIRNLKVLLQKDPEKFLKVNIGRGYLHRAES